MGKLAHSAIVSEEWGPLDRPLDRILGTRTANALGKLGLSTCGDLLAHIPFRLAHRGELLPIEAVHEGDTVTVVARVIDSHVRPMNRRRGYLLSVRIADGAHTLSLTFFGKSARPLNYHATRLAPGTLATFSGTISSYRGELQLSHPEYEVLDTAKDIDPEKIAQPIPIYHASAAIPSWKIHAAVDIVLDHITAADVPDPLPEDYRAEHKLLTAYQAMYAAHRPSCDDDWQRALLRFKHEEAFILQALIAQQVHANAGIPAPALHPRSDGVLAAFDRRLPFTLTAGQRDVGRELSEEMAVATPMRRLLQGDVGSGKTIVALRAMLQAVDAGYQAVLVAPTEVLAAQHYETFRHLLGDLAAGGELGAPEISTRLELLTGSLPAAAKRRTLANIASGMPQIIVGTHALFEDRVQLPRLGFVVIDEQHRFGVDQRDRLASGSHLLVMTATPIPRTIAMTTFGELRVSTLRELPSGRQPVQTALVPADNAVWVERMWQRAREEIAAGGRVYIVCPAINAETSEADMGIDPVEESSVPAQSEGAAGRRPLASVTSTVELLATIPALAGIPVGYVHGQLSSEEKSQAMARFASGQTPILVSTTVIEVGVDVPEATMMIILDAERFGLSQLHQLRGRVGRGTAQSLCLAVFHVLPGTVAFARLEAFAGTTDGFALAQRDVELRSEGNVLGRDQSGRVSSLRFVRVTKDEDIIDHARRYAREMIGRDPELRDQPVLAVAIDRARSAATDYLDRS
ncbi:ATP-dependent DNA helicase RecG [Trueperella sp. LYQ141]|uniref:ATP-dependent DNA helicase RecG n=1 Tax=Trueperella sp. LYQ141 TaxID=3391058 RepID=UPI0039830604